MGAREAGCKGKGTEQEKEGTGGGRFCAPFPLHSQRSLWGAALWMTDKFDFEQFLNRTFLFGVDFCCS